MAKTEPNFSVGDIPENEGKKRDAREQANRGLRIVRENPLGLILCGLAVGLVAGAVAPVTDIEREKFAPVRDELVGHAQQAVSDVVDHTKRVVEETVAAATDSATKHGQELAVELQQEFGMEQSAAESNGPKPPA